MANEVTRAGVIGLGVMGFDIAFLYAMKGHRTLAYDASSAVAQSFASRVDGAIDRLGRRNRISESEVENIRDRLTLAGSVDHLAGLDLVTEAVSENTGAKVSVYRSLREAGFKGILTSNTSSIPREFLLKGGSYERKKFASTHFFNPVLYTQMVEVVRGDMDEAAIGSTLSFLRKLGRNPVDTQDISGFVSNSVLMYYAVMALHLLGSGARIEQIDGIAKQMGLLPPFLSFDSWKPSIVEDVTRVMFEIRGDGFLRSSKLLRALAKDNPRFYVEQKPNQEIYKLVGEVARSPGESMITTALRASIRVAAARVVELGEDPRTVDFISADGLKIPHAPLKEIDKTGAGALLDELDEVSREMPESNLGSPEILAAMSKERESFYKGGQPNSWIRSFVERRRS
ncbi:MAG: 3-hydroxyacyl-CoA dehydrogenase family protein, partial [Candidatus Binatia bacterium]